MVQFQKLVYGAILSLIIGWVLYIGKDVFIPVALIVGVTVVFLYAVFLCIIPKPIAAIKHL